MDASANADGKSRGGLGPRLKSYLSSSNLFGLVPPSEFEQEIDDDTGWPSLNPVYDETTTSPSLSLDRWMSALRYRLWKYDDIPLGTEYNASILWMTERYIKVSEENKRLQAELLELSRQNQELLRTRIRSPSSVHRPSNSLPNGDLSAWKESLQYPRAKRRSISFSDETTRIAARSLSQERMVFFEQGIGFSGVPLEPYASRSEKPDKNAHGGNNESNTYQPATSHLANTKPEHVIEDINNYQLDAKNNLQTLAVTSEQNFPSPSERSRPSSSHQHLQSLTNLREVSRVNYRRRKSSGSVSLPARRVFSFCPGDDKDVLESFAEYSRQQRPELHNPDQHLGSSTTEMKKSLETTADHIQDRKDLAVSRGTSQSSVITVVKASEGKKVASKIPHHENKKVLEQNTSEETDRETAPAERPQGPLAAALAATARFGKAGKRR